MDTKEFKVQIPEGYEIDKKNSTFECIKFKPKDITYEEVCKEIFINRCGFFISNSGEIVEGILNYPSSLDRNNATNREQLRKLLALNQLLNIAEYYNRLHTMIDKQYVISYNKATHDYVINVISVVYDCGVRVVFNRAEDAQAVIDSPNFRKILNTVYKYKNN